MHKQNTRRETNPYNINAGSDGINSTTKSWWNKDVCRSAGKVKSIIKILPNHISQKGNMYADTSYKILFYSESFYLSLIFALNCFLKKNPKTSKNVNTMQDKC